VVVFFFDGPFEVDFVWLAEEAVVVARLEAVGAGREHLFRWHAATEDAEAATGLAIVDQCEFDVRFVGEFAGDGSTGAPVRTDDDYVNHTPDLSERR
jgi:hypothetical protein